MISVLPTPASPPNNTSRPLPSSALTEQPLQRSPETLPLNQHIRHLTLAGHGGKAGPMTTAREKTGAGGRGSLPGGRPAKLGNAPDAAPGPAGLYLHAQTAPGGTRWPALSVLGAQTTTESLKPVLAVGIATDAIRPLVPQAVAGRHWPCNDPSDRSNQ